MVRSVAAAASRVLAVASVLSMAVTAAAADTDWLRFRSERGRFAAELPGRPEEIRSRRATLGGIVYSSEYLVRRGATEFRVEHHDLPWLAKFLVSTDALLKLAKDALVEEEHGDELSSAVVSLRGYPARQVSFRVRAEPDLAGDALFVLVGGRLYVVATLGPQAERDAAALDRFFRSFEAWEP